MPFRQSFFLDMGRCESFECTTRIVRLELLQNLQYCGKTPFAFLPLAGIH